jgi:3'(2'), 5'-bisphosphate nucleotidase
VALAHRTWFIDPLDGTKEFIAGGDDYAVMIGLAVDGQPRLGVVLQPATGWLWSGVVDEGRAHLTTAAAGTRALDVRKRELGERGFTVAVSRSHKSRIANAVAQALDAHIVEMGSVGVKIGALIDGRVDAYLSGSSRMKLWDTCGPVAIARAAGALVTAIDGAPLRFSGDLVNKGGIRALTPVASLLYSAHIDRLVAQLVRRTGQ